MDWRTVGIGGVVAGGLLMIYLPEVGIFTATAGIFVLAVTAEKKETPKTQGTPPQGIEYRVLKDKVVALDSDGKVLGVRDLPEEPNQRRLVGNNR